MSYLFGIYLPIYLNWPPCFCACSCTPQSTQWCFENNLSQIIYPPSNSWNPQHGLWGHVWYGPGYCSELIFFLLTPLQSHWSLCFFTCAKYTPSCAFAPALTKWHSSPCSNDTSSERTVCFLFLYRSHQHLTSYVFSCHFAFMPHPSPDLLQESQECPLFTLSPLPSQQAQQELKTGMQKWMEKGWMVNIYVCSESEPISDALL